MASMVPLIMQSTRIELNADQDDGNVSGMIISILQLDNDTSPGAHSVTLIPTPFERIALL